MKRFAILFFIVFYAFSLQAQTNSLDAIIQRGDSLFKIQKYEEAARVFEEALGKQSTIDTLALAPIYLRLSETAELTNQYSDAIVYHLKYLSLEPFLNQEKNLYYIGRVKTSFDRAVDSLGKARLYYRFAVLLTKEANRKWAFVYFKRALDLAKRIKHYAAAATIANDLAGEYWDAGDKDLSTKMYEEALAASIAANDSNRIAGTYLNLADNYSQEGDFKTGIRIHLKALKIKELLKDSSRLSYYYQNAAELYYELRDFEKWEEYIQKAYRLNAFESAGTPLDRVTIYGGLGGLAKWKNETEKAMLYFDTLLVLSKKIGYFNGQKTALDNQAKIYKEKGDYKKALQILNQSEAFLTDNPFHHISHNNTKAELLQAIKKPQEALALVIQNQKQESLGNYASEKLRTFRLLYELNTQLANYSEAFRWNDSLHNLENKLRDADVRKEIAELETQYQTEKREQQISLLTAENKIKNQRMRQALLFIGFLLALVSLILFLLYFRRKKAAFKESELQQQLLRSQMNPHFIFNVMGSIQGFLYKNEASKAADYLSRFAALSRSVLDFSSQEKISLKEEIEMLQNYIELERARMEEPFDVDYNIQDDLETDFIEIPPMLLQPFVENAIKHGLKDIDYLGKLSLCFKETNGFVAVEIVDNGNGLSIQNDKNHKSKALEIFRQRKKGIEHKFKKELTFEFQNLKDIDSTKQGVRVYIHLPILNDD